MTTKRSLSRNPFEILGVSVEHSDDEIKAAFRRKAKQLHPDLHQSRSKGLSMDDAHSKFIELKSAYDTLIEPEKRKRYQQDQSQQHTPQQEEAYEEFFKNFHRPRTTRGSSNTLVPFKTGYSYEQFKIDLEDALEMAYIGPTFVPSEDQSYPDAFETEERNLRYEEKYSVGDEVVHVVSGQQLLGSVAEVNPYFIAASDAHSKHHNYQHQQNQQQNQQMEEVLELKWLGRTTARAFRNDNHIIFEKAVSSDATSNSSTLSFVLEAKLVISKKLSIFGSTREVLINKHGMETHTVLRQHSLGVNFINLFSKKGFIEYKCSRAWLPDSSLWLHPPRDPDFDIGGWYIEHNRDGHLSRPRSKEETQRNDGSHEKQELSSHYKPHSQSVDEDDDKDDEEVDGQAMRVGSRAFAQVNEERGIEQSLPFSALSPVKYEKDCDRLSHTIPMLLCSFLTLDKLKTGRF
jgi:curved DNA-binding protein CbpA